MHAPSLEITFDPSRVEARAIHSAVAATYWSPGIRPDIVATGVRHSIVCTAWRGGELVGFARVVTDRATIAYLCDVWVEPAERGTGVGTALVRACEAHPELQTVRRWLLATRDAHGLYARLGYQPVDPNRWMERPMPAARWQGDVVAAQSGNATINHRLNELGQPVGPPVDPWVPPPMPLSEPVRALRGTHVALVPLDAAAHASDLWQALQEDQSMARWTYLPYGPFSTRPEFDAWLHACAADRDPLRLAVLDLKGRAVGMTSFMRIAPAMGSIELGHLLFGPALAGTPGSTETSHMMMAHAFELGYRRVEWKCDSLHAASRRAAVRLGFRFEGIHRRAVVYKGRSRDTAWYSLIDSEWLPTRARHIAWLNAANFDEHGTQRQRMERPPQP